MSRPVGWPTMNLEAMPCAGREWGDPVRVPTTISAAPCDGCRHATRCRATAEACAAFRDYYNGIAWQTSPREPSRTIGRKLRLR